MRTDALSPTDLSADETSFLARVRAMGGRWPINRSWERPLAERLARRGFLRLSDNARTARLTGTGQAYLDRRKRP